MNTVKQSQLKENIYTDVDQFRNVEKLKCDISKLNESANSTLRKVLAFFLEGFFPDNFKNLKNEDKKQFVEITKKYVNLHSNLKASIRENLENKMGKLFVDVFGGKAEFSSSKAEFSSSKAVAMLNNYLAIDKDIKEAIKNPRVNVLNGALELTKQLVADVESAAPKNGKLNNFKGIFNEEQRKIITSVGDPDKKTFNHLQRNVNEVRSVLRNENIDSRKLQNLRSELYFIERLLNELGKEKGWIK